MDFNIVKIAAFITLIIVYVTVRKLFKKFADFTEYIGNPSQYEEENEALRTKIVALEEKINIKNYMEITNLQQQVDEWIKTIGVRYFNELTNMAMLTEEVGEVARIIARRYGEQSEKESDKSKDLGEELADVLFVTLCLANQTGVNLQEAFDKKMKVKTERDKDRHQNNGKLK